MPWDPVRDLLTMQERLESLFGRAAPGWAPAVDLVEQPDRYVLTVELPGCRRDDVRIDSTPDTVTITGLRPPSCTPEKYQQLERGQGPFSRSFRFAFPVDTDAVTADLVDGVLTITLPKSQAGATRIDVT
jgi:HSP20 family protein